MNIKCTILIMFIVFCCNDNKPKKNNQKKKADDKHNYIIDDYKKLKFPKNIKRNYSDPNYTTYADKIKEFFERNEGIIKQQIKNDVVEAFKNYYSNDKEKNYLFIDHFFHNPNYQHKKNKIELDENQKNNLFQYFNKNNIYCDKNTHEIFWPKQAFNIGTKQTRFNAFDMGIYKRKISSQELRKLEKKENFNMDGISLVGVCSFCGDYIYYTRGKYLNETLLLTDMDFFPSVMFACKNEQCINKGKKQKEDIDFGLSLCLGKGKYTIQIETHANKIINRQVEFEEFMQFSIRRYIQNITHLDFKDFSRKYDYKTLKLIIKKDSKSYK